MRTPRYPLKSWLAAFLGMLLLSLPAGGAKAGEAAPDPAGDPSLVDELHSQGILTDEKYAQLKERETRTQRVIDYLTDFRIGTLTYLDYSYGEHTAERMEYFQGQPVYTRRYEAWNRFTVTRGYIDIRKDIVSWLGFRATPDVHQDEAGDFVLRMKYLYAEFRPPQLLFLSDLKARVGIVPMPWLAFEESINPYRCQGTMFLERAGIFNSADVGVSAQGYWGSRLQDDLGSDVLGAFAGKWGSWCVGVYNGAGYHENEDNNNKVPEYRVTVRPLPSWAPGLQLSYFGLYGEGNLRTTWGGWPLYAVNLGMLSYQNEWVVFTGQYARVLGNSSGTLVVPGTNQALHAQGFSFFFNTQVPRLLDRKLNVFGRYDYFDPDVKGWVAGGDDAYQLIIAGLAWRFFERCQVLGAYQRTLYDKNSGGVGMPPVANNDLKDSWTAQLVLQIAF